MFKALLYAYVLGGLTFIPLVVAVVIFITVYTSVPVGDTDMAKKKRGQMEADSVEEEKDNDGEVMDGDKDNGSAADPQLELNDKPTTRKGWLTVRRTFEEEENDTSYVTLVRSFLDSRSKDPKRSRPKDMWYAVLKRNILYLYEDEGMTECEAAIELSGHDVVIYPEGLPDGELYAKRNAICLRRKTPASSNLASVTKEMKLGKEEVESQLERKPSSAKKKAREREALLEADKKIDAARDEAFDPETPWFIFVRSNLEMEDWYFSLLHASSHPAQTPTLLPLRSVFDPTDMNHLVNTLDNQPDVIPMRWLNALLGRIFFSHYRTHHLEAYIIGRLMKKLEKVKRPQFLTDIAVTEVSVGTRPPMFSKPMLKELTKEGDASLEVHFQYKGEIRITIEATAVINLGARFKSYTVKLVLAAVLKELEGNLLVKVKRPPSNRIWYAFTQTPRMVLAVEPIVSDRQITWGMILSTIESQIKEIIRESVVMPNMDDIAFFDSLPYAHRGGIWADASRQMHPRAFVTPPEGEEDVQSSQSAPNPGSSSTEPPATLTSQSDDLLAVKSSSSSSSSDSKSALSDPTDSTRNNTRRKTWFSSVKSDDGSGLLSDVFSGSGDENGSKHRRGRKGYTGTTTDEEGPSRSPSRSSRRRSAHSVSSQKSYKTDQGSQSEAGTSYRSHSRLSNRDDDEDSSYLRSRPTTPERRRSDVSLKNRSPSPPSFFSTLKSKAGDKQALTNTAKETIRKWSANWGLKKDSTDDSSSHDGASTSSRLNAGTSPPSGHKPRASYAEVRAAVAERKEKERLAETEGNSNSNPPTTLSNGSAHAQNQASSSDNPIYPSIVSSSARLSTPRLATKKSTPSISRVNTDIDAEPPVSLETPIHVQPQAKTMSIPGIHAKNRGEIQSLGHVASPQTPTPPVLSTAPTPSTIIESKLKNPAIQTVYRFWKSPGNAGNSVTSQATSQGSSGGGDTEITQSGGSGSGSDSRPGEAVERPSPPPLPPRHTNTQAGPTLASTSEATLNPPAGALGSSSAASEALKNTVSKDEIARSVSPQEQGDSQPGVANAHHGSAMTEPTLHEVMASGDVAGPTRGALNTSRSSVGSASTMGSASGNGDGDAQHGRTPPPLPPRPVPAIA
ncbi:endoplasmic reticulum protein [Coprinopsis cinerea okayama7|uniref:Endoplasmic reticulum protein n=1 Tax=Coprinopsis cinerea (strain Okayama-7 / 130 / ATCC MYA-4618 / FGSC 9003) TaxID=240176 RepID=D6RJQ5_COPC7|nr:endoplasmic reticulum protein [Coprinopsis cinerea okayama7\|eukprot:XP_002912200.1 endoplasmic reticulum protein [Coprinopsis cinerea okayama7\